MPEPRPTTHQAPRTMSGARQANVLRASGFVIAAALVVGCEDVTGIKAQFNNIEGKPTVYAMNSAAVTLPAAVAIRSASAVRIDASFLFDLAFDLDTAGAVVVYTQGRVASEIVPSHRVGLQVSAEPFSTTLKAPTSGYVYDSLLTVAVGQTVIIDVLEASCGQSILGANIRAKMQVVSVDVVTRAIELHVLANPNCGFRALNQGEPKD